MTVEGKYILYAEDDLDDQELLTEMLHHVDGNLKLICVEDGYQVLSFLENLRPGNNYPCIIVLDINMPNLDGMQTLKILKSQDHYRSIPVLIFSTSSAELDRVTAMNSGAAEFITKPVARGHLENIAGKFATYCYTVPQNIA